MHRDDIVSAMAKLAHSIFFKNQFRSNVAHVYTISLVYICAVVVCVCMKCAVGQLTHKRNNPHVRFGARGSVWLMAY